LPVPEGLSEGENRRVQKRQNRMSTLGESLKEHHKKIMEGQASDSTDRATPLLGYADMASLIYAGWDQGELTPNEFASPSMYRAVWEAYPELAGRAKDATLKAIRGGEPGDPLRFMRLAGEVNPDDIDQTTMTGDVELLLNLRAKVTLGVAVGKMVSVANDLRIMLRALKVLDAENRQNFVDIPWRAEVMRSLVEKWAPDVEDPSLKENWVAVAERATEALGIFEPLMMAVYTKSMVDYQERAAYMRPY
jgi:hypothetical protein